MYMKGKLRTWLTLEYCESIFNVFKKDLEFDQPIPPFSDRFPGVLEGILGSVRQSFGGGSFTVAKKGCIKLFKESIKQL